MSNHDGRMSDDQIDAIETKAATFGMHPMEILNGFNNLLTALKLEREANRELERDRRNLLDTDKMALVCVEQQQEIIDLREKHTALVLPTAAPSTQVAVILFLTRLRVFLALVAWYADMGIAKAFECRVNGKIRKIVNPNGVNYEDLMMYIHCMHDRYSPEGCEHAKEFLEMQGIEINWREGDGFSIVALANSEREKLWKAYCETRGIEHDTNQLHVWSDKSYEAVEDIF